MPIADLSTGDLRREARRLHRKLRPSQIAAFRAIPPLSAGETVVLEGQMGLSGKTPIGIAFLTAALKHTGGWGLYLTPSKPLQDQLVRQYPASGIAVIKGRKEYLCPDPKYPGTTYGECPCGTLTDSPYHGKCHRTETGTIYNEPPRAGRDLYYEDKLAALKSPIVAMNFAYAAMQQIFAGQFGRPSVVVIDEADQVAEAIRSAMETRISARAILAAYEAAVALRDKETSKALSLLLSFHVRFVDGKEAQRKAMKWDDPVNISEAEMTEYLRYVGAVDWTRFRAALRRNLHRFTLDELSELARAVSSGGRWQHAIKYALPVRYKGRSIPSSSFAYCETRLDNGAVANRWVVLRPWKVSHLVRGYLTGSEATVAMSGTIGDREIFGFETGITGRFLKLPHAKVERRVLVLDDDLDLRMRPGHRRQVKRAEEIAVELASLPGANTLVLTNTHEQAHALCSALGAAGVPCLSYGNGTSCSAALQRFLHDRSLRAFVGPVTGIGRGIDLPGRCNLLLVYKPPYAKPTEPQSQFESRRLKERYWPLMFWRASTATAQAMGRIFRGPDDRGAIVLLCRSFRQRQKMLGLTSLEGLEVLKADQLRAEVADYVAGGV